MAAGFERLEIAEYRLPDDFTARLLSPSLIVYLDHVRENLRRVLELADGDPDRFRPHVKTSKIPAVFAELLRAGQRTRLDLVLEAGVRIHGVVSDPQATAPPAFISSIRWAISSGLTGSA